MCRRFRVTFCRVWRYMQRARQNNTRTHTHIYIWTCICIIYIYIICIYNIYIYDYKLWYINMWHIEEKTGKCNIVIYSAHVTIVLTIIRLALGKLVYHYSLSHLILPCEQVPLVVLGMDGWYFCGQHMKKTRWFDVHKQLDNGSMFFSLSLSP